jgi:UDP-glucose 4-epimerase/UDP-glucuronate decarboxylase
MLITGGTGFIGFHLASFLINKGHEVTIIDNLFRGQMDSDFKQLSEKVKFINADLTESMETLSALDKDYDCIFHFAAINGVKYAEKMPHYVLRTNLLSTIHVLDWCSKNPPRALIFASSSEVYSGAAEWSPIPIPTPENLPLTIGKPGVPRYSYACSKMTGEHLCLQYSAMSGFWVRNVRFHNIYGPRMGYDHVIPEWIVRIKKGENPFKIFGADQTRSFCYIEDAVAVLYRMCLLQDEENYTVNVGNSSEEISMRELSTLLFQVADFSPAVQELPPPVGSPSRRCPDTKLQYKLTGYEPQISIKEGIKKTYEWYRAHL